MDSETKEVCFWSCVSVVGLGLFLCLCFGGCYGCSKVQVADGFRDSTFRKLSETGIIWKTWEVETIGDGLRMGDGKITPETFRYTVNDPAVLAKLKELPPGKKARFNYRKFYTHWSPNGESAYFITSIETINE